MEQKPWFTSKTLWFNVLSFLWQFVGPLIGIPTLDDSTFSAFVLVANLILRVITKGAITLS